MGFDKVWLNPAVNVEIANLYAMTIATKVARIYTLDVKEHMTVAAWLAMLMHFNCTNDKKPDVGYLTRHKHISLNVDTEFLKAVLDEHFNSSNEFNISSVVKLIVQTGPSRMKDFSMRDLGSMVTSFSSNNMLTLVGIEYPAYWLSFILDVMSGSKNGLFYSIKGSGLKNDAVMLAKKLASSSLIFKTV
jgi:hypothetical protein